ncbi:hypothetical protein [Stenotrophomonas indicatrix]|uniref:hypothetical protein n=1 Tax=Stenotrophomonas indicatrix TaxID=2045451 RepID=UPI0028B14A5D|nr:hypothetical protein [Stenotrophomonas indicatrix]
MTKRRVPLHQNPRGFVEVDPEATKGAQLGVNLLDEQGRLLTRESLAGNSSGGTNSIASTLWRLIREIPLNIQKVAALATSGFAVRRSDGEWLTRTLQQGAGITISNPAGEAGDPVIGLADVPDSGAGFLLATTFDAKGRKTGSRPATITGTATQINVANGTAAAGLPTLSLAPEVLAALAEATSALQPSDVTGPSSVKVTPNGSGGIILQLDNDQASPAALTEYGTNSAGTRGWWRPALFESTGVINGGALSINAGDNTRFDMAQAVIGYVDWSVTPTQPTRVLSTVGPFTAQVVTNIATANATYVGIQMPAGTIIQQTSPFTNAQRRTIAQIGALVHSNNVNLNAINDQAATIRAGVNQVGDLMMAIGAMNLAGNIYSANGANLNINKSAGSIFKMGANFQASHLDPHVVSMGAQTALTFRYRLSNGTEGADTTNINPNQYESAPGVLTNIPILGNQWHVQRISIFQSGLSRIQYGQQLYGSLAAAIQGITTDSFNTEQNIAENGILRCYLVINRGLLGLLGSATFVNVSKFGATQAGGGVVPVHNDLSGLQGGSSGERYHATAAQSATLAALATSAHIGGLGMIYNSGTSVSFTSGTAAIQSTGLILTFPSTITKSGLSLAASTWYHCHGYSNAGVPDVEISTTAPAAAYFGSARSKAGDTSKRYLGSFRTTAAGQIAQFQHNPATGRVTYLGAPYVLTNVLSAGTATVNTTISCAGMAPLTAIEVDILITNVATSGEVVTTYSLAADPSSPFGYANPANGVWIAGHPVDASQAFMYRFASTPNGSVYIDAKAYTFAR